MLNIYTGREDIDKQRYMFARIRRQDMESERRRGIFLIVPDQFTLEAERSAFTYMDVPAFINPVVLSMNRLAVKVLTEAGERADHIDLYGKYMLLARLLYRNKGKLSLYQNLENSTVFISQLSEAIMSLKSHLVSPEALLECAEAAGDSLLGRKLRDVTALYAEYEEALTGGLPDSSDITRRFIELIPGSKILAGSAVWVYGFDYFSPLHLRALSAMSSAASEVNVVLTAERSDPFFALTNGMIDALAAASGEKANIISVAKDAEERGLDCSWLPEDEKPSEIAHIESTLFAGPLRPYPYHGDAYHGDGPFDRSITYHGDGPFDRSVDTLRFVAAQNYYAEAAAAAEAIKRLISEEGFRYRDILVVCNDQNRRASAVQRVFSANGIETFLDKRHEAGYNPVLSYITLLPEILSRGRRAEDILAWIGTGLTDVAEDDAEELENYAERYGLRGSAWQKPLFRGKDSYDEEVFARVSGAAKYAGDMIALFSERFGPHGSSARTARARTEGIKRFLEEDARLPEKIESFAARLEAEGYLEYALRMRGVWDVALDIFSQINAALGEIVMGAEEYATVLRVGFASVLMGVLPATSDCVTIGTMQRTRTGRVKAMFVLGANDGELPMFAEDEGLIDDSEKEALEELGLTAFRREENLHNEEQLAIYKNISKPTRYLHVSYTAFGADGKEDTKPSRIFERLRALFPQTPLEKAVEGTQGDGSLGTQGDGSLVSTSDTKEPSPCVPSPCVPVRDTERTNPAGQSLDAEKLRSLLPPVLSPTAIENYSRCPFAFLMERGIRLRELRKHEIDNRGMGDVYHEALKRFGEIMNEKGGAPSCEGSAWNTFERADTDAVVDRIFRDIEPSLLSAEAALLFDEGDPAAVYRRGRLESVVRDICWVLTERAASDGAERILFETGFGYGGEFGRVSIGEAGLEVAGRIDRIDVLPSGRAKVIDYKSGSEKWDPVNVKNGWQLQLMLYLKAIEKDYEPGGVSYFRIFEPSVNLSESGAPETPEEISEALYRQYRSDGVVLTDADDGARKTAAGEKALSKEEFRELRDAVDERLTEIAEGLALGRTPANPKQKAGSDNVTACTWCDYKSICNYEAT